MIQTLRIKLKCLSADVNLFPLNLKLEWKIHSEMSPWCHIIMSYRELVGIFVSAGLNELIVLITCWYSSWMLMNSDSKLGGRNINWLSSGKSNHHLKNIFYTQRGICIFVIYVKSVVTKMQWAVFIMMGCYHHYKPILIQVISYIFL